MQIEIKIQTHPKNAGEVQYQGRENKTQGKPTTSSVFLFFLADFFDFFECNKDESVAGRVDRT